MLGFEELEAVLLKTYLVVNGKPLVYLSEDCLGDVLIPKHFIYGQKSE